MTIIVKTFRKFHNFFPRFACWHGPYHNWWDPASQSLVVIRLSSSHTKTLKNRESVWFCANVTCNQGRNEGGTISRALSTVGRRMTGGCCWKVPTMSKYFLQYSTFASKKPHVRTWGRQTCFLPRAPSNLVTPLVTGVACVNLAARRRLRKLYELFISIVISCNLQACISHKFVCVKCTAADYFNLVPHGTLPSPSHRSRCFCVVGCPVLLETGCFCHIYV